MILPHDTVRTRGPLLPAALLAVLTTGCATTGSGRSERPPAPAAPSGVTARMDGVELRELDHFGVTLAFEIVVENASDEALEVTELRYHVASGGRTVAGGGLALAERLAPRESRMLPCGARVVFQDVIERLESARLGQVIACTARLDLLVAPERRAPGRLTVVTDTEFPLPAALRVTLVTAALAGPPDGGLLTLGLDVANGNHFPLDVGGLSLAIELGGLPVARGLPHEPVPLAPDETVRIEVRVPVPADRAPALRQRLRGPSVAWRLAGSVKGLTPFGIMELPITSRGEAPIGQ